AFNWLRKSGRSWRTNFTKFSHRTCPSDAAGAAFAFVVTPGKTCRPPLPSQPQIALSGPSREGARADDKPIRGRRRAPERFGRPFVDFDSISLVPLSAIAAIPLPLSCPLQLRADCKH